MTAPDSAIIPERVPVEDCSLAGALALLGDRWTLLVLREAFYGVRRFEDMRRDLGTSRTVLSDRLATLVDAGLLAKEPYREGRQRTRHWYRLTKKGTDLFPALIALMQWGDRHLGKGGQPRLVLCDARTGKPVRAALISEDGEVITHPGNLKAEIRHRK